MIKLTTGFDVRSNVAIDSRFIKTKAEMRDTSSSVMPALYFCLCSDDGGFYLYNENNVESPETGKYKMLETSGHEPMIYYYSPDPDATEEEIEEEIEALVKSLKAGDAIISKEGTSDITYKAFPNGKWDSTSDLPLFGATSNIYRYDVYATVDENVSSKVQVVGSMLIALSAKEADNFFEVNSQSLGYAMAAPAGKGYLIPSTKSVVLEDIKEGYDSLDAIIADCVPTASNKDVLKPWTLTIKI